MRIKATVFLAFILLTGCSKDECSDGLEKSLVGNKYAHLLFETREECEASWELYFMNCAQTIEVLNETQVEIMLTDILYRADFYVENGKFVVKSSPDTYEFSQDLIFDIAENGNLKLGDEIWVEYDDTFYEIYDIFN